MNDRVYRLDLGTSVIKLEYDFCQRVGILYMPELCCTDMTGCIALFKRIDRNVQKIHTVSGERPDVMYVKRNQKWCAWHCNCDKMPHRCHDTEWWGRELAFSEAELFAGLSAARAGGK